MFYSSIQPDHELYRQWIAVHDNLNMKDRGIQGFLLVSIVVLGPGDALRVHNREAEIEQELAESTGGNPLDDSKAASTPPLVLVPPAIELKLQFLLVRVLRAEHLPAMDTGGLLIGAQGIDAFFQVVFAANAPCKTSFVTVKGRGNLSPDFYEELWLAVRITIPSLILIAKPQQLQQLLNYLSVTSFGSATGIIDKSVSFDITSYGFIVRNMGNRALATQTGI